MKFLCCKCCYYFLCLEMSQLWIGIRAFRVFVEGDFNLNHEICYRVDFKQGTWRFWEDFKGFQALFFVKKAFWNFFLFLENFQLYFFKVWSKFESIGEEKSKILQTDHKCSSDASKALKKLHKSSYCKIKRIFSRNF